MEETKNKKYFAFISYRHADNKQPGRQWATWLHQAIETYEVPTDLVGKVNERGDLIPARIFPIFRDEEELPAHSNLGDAITRALDETRLLIVLCSPRAVESSYVADEIEYFKKLGCSDRIIAAIIDGEPNCSWDEGKLKGGFNVEDECFPVPLQFEYDNNGRRTQKHAEPIASDFRVNNEGKIEEGWTSVEAYRLHLEKRIDVDKISIAEKLKTYQKQQHLMVLKIVAGVLGVPLGELTQRDKEYQLLLERQKAKKLRRWLAGVFVLACAAVVAGVFAFVQQQRAQEEQISSELRAADSFIANGYLLTRDNKISQAKESLVEAIDIYKTQDVSAIAAITQYLKTSEISADPLVEINLSEAITAMQVSSDNKLVIGTVSGDVYLYDQLTGVFVDAIATLQGRVHSVEFSADNSKLLASTETQVMLYDLVGSQILLDFKYEKQRLFAARFFHKSKKLLLITHYDDESDDESDGESKESTQYVIYDYLNETSQSFAGEGRIYSIAISPDETNIIVGQVDGAIEIQVSPPELVNEYSGEFGLSGHKLMYAYHVDASSFSASGKYVALGSNDGVIEIWDQQENKQVYSRQFIDSQGITNIQFVSEAPWEIIFSGSSGIIKKVSAYSDSLIHEHAREVTAIEFAQGSLNSLFSSSLDGTLVLSQINLRKSSIAVSAASFIMSLDYSVDGNLLLSSGMLDEEVKLWDSASGELLSAIQIEYEVHGAVFDKDPSLIWVAVPGKVELRNTLDSSLVGEIDVDNQGFVSLTIANDRQTLMMSIDRSSESAASEVMIIPIQEAARGMPVVDGKIELSPRTIMTMEAGNIFVSSTPNADVIAAVGDAGQLLIWDNKTEKLSKFKMENSVARADSIAVSPSGKWIITGHVDSIIRIFDSATGEQVKALKGHDSGVVGVWISPDERWLLSAGREGSVKSWELAKGKQISSFGRNPILNLRVSDSGRIARGVRGDRDYYGDVDMILVNSIQSEKLISIPKEIRKIKSNPSSDDYQENLLTTMLSWYLLRGEVDMAEKLTVRAVEQGIALPHEMLARFAKESNNIPMSIEHLKLAIRDSNNDADKVRYQLIINSYLDPIKLMNAIRADDIEVVNHMLALGVNPNFIDSYTGKPPLQVAVSNASMEQVSALLLGGSDINFLSARDETALFDTMHSPMFWQLLLDNGVNIHQVTTNGRTVLHRAAFRGDLELIRTLLRLNIDKTVTDVDGESAFDAAVAGSGSYPELGVKHWQEILSLLTLNK